VGAGAGCPDRSRDEVITDAVLVASTRSILLNSTQSALIESLALGGSVLCFSSPALQAELIIILHFKPVVPRPVD
jgi:hypothetical protein